MAMINWSKKCVAWDFKALLQYSLKGRINQLQTERDTVEMPELVEFLENPFSVDAEMKIKHLQESINRLTKVLEEVDMMALC